MNTKNPIKTKRILCCKIVESTHMHSFTSVSGYANNLVYLKYGLRSKEFIYIRWLCLFEYYKGFGCINYMVSVMSCSYLTSSKWFSCLSDKGLIYRMQKSAYTGKRGISAKWLLTTKGLELLEECFKYLNEHEIERIKELTRNKFVPDE